MERLTNPQTGESLLADPSSAAKLRELGWEDSRQPAPSAPDEEAPAEINDEALATDAQADEEPAESDEAPAPSAPEAEAPSAKPKRKTKSS